MDDLSGRVAVITGGGSGIGRGMALAFAREGMKVAVLDVDVEAAGRVAAEIEALGASALAMACDVSIRADVRDAADLVFAHLGAVHVLCNNAGVTMFRSVAEMSDNDWDWMLGVNLLGIVHGYQSFVPRMVAQREGGHIINTSSAAGVVPDVVANHSAYAASKAAAVALAVNLRLELADHGIGVSALCPGLVRTGILEAGRARPDRFGGPVGDSLLVPGMADPMRDALDPEAVGRIVVAGIRHNRKFIFTHPGMDQAITQYYETMLADAET